MKLNHRRSVALMVCVTLLWSMAGVVSRQLEAARSFEVTFWRSAFTVLTLVPALLLLRGPKALRASIVNSRIVWWSGLCWCVMFTAFMLALTLTTVANVLVTMALGPLFTALSARFVLGAPQPTRTWIAIGLAGVGMGWMYAGEFSAAAPDQLLGVVVALAVPIAAAANWSLIQHSQTRQQVDLLPAVLIGAVLSSVLTLPMALPFAASAHDLGWLALLGVAQLAIPCLLSVAAGKHLSAPEAALLALLEVIFGVIWAWWGAGEAPGVRVLTGGLAVIAALAFNEALALQSTASASRAPKASLADTKGSASSGH